MNVSDRIEKIVSQIENRTVADIGTDHGYISIFAAKNKDIKKIIACDLNNKPLLSCKKNIERYHLEDKIETRLGSGLTKININEVETIIIAGMGGNLIVDILKESLSMLDNIKQLILQPQSNSEKVRRFLYNNGFYIKNELIIYEDEIYYNIINSSKGKNDSYTDMEFMFGKINIKRNLDVLKKQIIIEKQKNIYLKTKILENANNIDLAKENIEKFDNKNKIIDEILLL